MAWKRVEEMSGSEVVSEAASLASYMESCRESGQGVNSKETVRYNACLERMIKERLIEPYGIYVIATQWDPSLVDFKDLFLHVVENGTTLREMRALFA